MGLTREEVERVLKELEEMFAQAMLEQEKSHKEFMDRHMEIMWKIDRVKQAYADKPDTSKRGRANG